MKKTSILAGSSSWEGWPHRLGDADREVAVEWINICNPCGNNDLPVVMT